MKLFSMKGIMIASLLSVILFFSHDSYCQQYDNRITVFYSHGVKGLLEPCG